MHRERAQTAQDFLLGMTIFLVTAAFVFAFLPSLMTSYDDGPGAAEAAAAERASLQILDNVTNTDTNIVDEDTIATDFGSLKSNPHDTLGLNRGLQVHVDVLNANQSRPVTVNRSSDSTMTLTAGRDVGEQATAVNRRLIELDGVSECDPTCYLVVHVW